MSWDFVKETEQVARKNYECEAMEWISNLSYDYLDFDKEDIEIIEKALYENYQILKGEIYVKASGMFDGEFTVFRARKDMDRICKKYNIYNV